MYFMGQLLVRDHELVRSQKQCLFVVNNTNNYGFVHYVLWILQK